MLRRPHPRCAAMTAMPTAAAGMSSRTKSASNTRTPRLLGQRPARPIDNARRGLRISHSASARKIPRAAPPRMKSSLFASIAVKIAMPPRQTISCDRRPPRRCWRAGSCLESGTRPPHRQPMRGSAPGQRGEPRKRPGGRMEVFVQQLINGITLGSIYGLIAIGYTMVFGIIGMVNFAHGDVFMVSAFIGLIILLILTSWLGMASVALALLIVLIVAMVFTSLVNWVIERVAYRPLRGSFRLAPLISAIGMSIFLSNFVQVTQGPRNKSVPPLLQDVIVIMEGNGYDVTISYRQLIIWSITAVLLAAFWYLVSKTSLGR